MAHISQADVNVVEFEAACGVGIEVTPEMIETEVSDSIAQVKDELISKRYRFNTGLLMANVRKKLKWADGKKVKSEIDVQIFDLLGHKTDADLLPPPKTEKKSGKDKGSTATKDNSN